MLRLWGGSLGLGESLYVLFKDNVLDYFMEKLQWLKEPYERSGFKKPFRIYISLYVFSLILSFVIPLITLPAIFIVIFKIPLLNSIALSILITIAIASIVSALMFYAPVHASKVRGDKIDAMVPYIAAYLGVLAASGVSSERIVERYLEVAHILGVEKEFKDVIKLMVFKGSDLPTALREVSRKSPSTLLGEILEGFASIAETGGNPRTFFQYEVESIIKAREARLRDILNSLSAVAEIYISLVVVAPLVFTIMLMIIASLGGFPFSPYVLIGIINLVLVPAIALGLVIIIDSLLSRV